MARITIVRTTIYIPQPSAPLASQMIIRPDDSGDCTCTKARPLAVDPRPPSPLGAQHLQASPSAFLNGQNHYDEHIVTRTAEQALPISAVMSAIRMIRSGSMSASRSAPCR